MSSPRVSPAEDPPSPPKDLRIKDPQTNPTEGTLHLLLPDPLFRQDEEINYFLTMNPGRRKARMLSGY